jgi:hypothetical protein
MSTVMRILILFMVEELPRPRYMFGSPYGIRRLDNGIRISYALLRPFAMFLVNVRMKESYGWLVCSKTCASCYVCVLLCKWRGRWTKLG